MKKTALVTGAGTGIGRACAVKLAEEGYSVAVHFNRSEKGAEETVRLIEENGGRAIALRADLRDAEAVKALKNQVISQLGCPDVIVNNAGISRIAQIQDVSENEWDDVLGANLKSVFLVTRSFIPEMIGRGKGSIVNISSMWGQVGASCESVYSASKGGIISFTKALAKELGPSGIRVNCISPGCIRTAMMEEFSDDVVDELIEETPLLRLGEPEDVADAVVFLAGEKASFITGQVLGVNGGFVI